MSDVFGISGWAVAVLAVVLGLAMLLAASRLRKRRHRRDDAVVGPPEPRLAILESTAVDAQRRLVLVACDEVEHLLLIGGPADLVVDNDVGRPRLVPATAPAVADQVAVPRAQGRPQELSAASEPVLPPPEVAAESKAAETSRPAKAADAPNRPAEAPARPSPGRPALAAVPAPVPQPAGKSNSAPAPAIAMQVAPARTVAAKPAEAADAKGAKPKQAADAQFGRRDPPAAPAAAPAQPAATALQPGPKPAALPAAEMPWPDGDSLENEIVKALRVEPKAVAPSPSPAQQRDAPTAAKTTAPATTLGDLADRLEEALAREVQNAGQKGSRLDLGLDAFGFDQTNGGHAPPEAPKEPGPERKAKPEAVKAIPPAPEPETRREARIPPERQEEAPVISLSARRREPVDPLEDEMARLLGELTGDSGRR